MDASLEAIFLQYTHNQPLMDSRTFVKMCKESHLLDKKFTTTTADIAFTKARGASKTKIDAKIWRALLDTIAEKKGVAPEVVIEAVVATGGPTYTGTKTDDVKWHDSKELYTGVHAHGGPVTIEKNRTHDLADFADRKPMPKKQ